MTVSDVTYHDLIAKNRRNSSLLVVGFVVFVAVLLGVMGSALTGGDARAAGAFGGTALAIAIVMAFFSYYSGGSMVLRMSGAKLIAHGDDPELYNVVEEMAIASAVPLPPVYLIEDTAMNAFATGRDPEHAALAITRGLRKTLTRDELQVRLTSPYVTPRRPAQSRAARRGRDAHTGHCARHHCAILRQVHPAGGVTAARVHGRRRRR